MCVCVCQAVPECFSESKGWLHTDLVQGRTSSRLSLIVPLLVRNNMFVVCMCVCVCQAVPECFSESKGWLHTDLVQGRTSSRLSLIVPLLVRNILFVCVHVCMCVPGCP
jgi:hypothetical protein